MHTTGGRSNAAPARNGLVYSVLQSPQHKDIWRSQVTLVYGGPRHSSHALQSTQYPLCFPPCARHRTPHCIEIWEWARTWLEAIHRTDLRRILTYWLLWPSLRLWPRQCHQATLWILVNMVFYVVQNCRMMSLQNYIDFLHWTRWETYQETKRMEVVSNYREVLYTVSTRTPDEQYTTNQRGGELTMT